MEPGGGDVGKVWVKPFGWKRCWWEAARGRCGPRLGGELAHSSPLFPAARLATNSAGNHNQSYYIYIVTSEKGGLYESYHLDQCRLLSEF